MACEGDNSPMISHMENFISMGVDLIICAPIDQGAVKSVCLQAMDAGIPVVFNGQYPAYYDQLSGGAAAEEAMTMNPQIKLFLSFREVPAVGVNNSITSQPTIDLSKYAVFAGSYSDGTSKPLIESSKVNKSILRGSCNYGTHGQTVKVFMAEELFQVTKRILFGEAETPFWVLDDIWTVDAIGYDFLIDNPENNFLMN